MEDLVSNITPPLIAGIKKVTLKQCKLETFGIKESNNDGNLVKFSLKERNSPKKSPRSPEYGR